MPLRDMVSMTKGKHSLDFGGELSLEKNMIVGNLYNFGSLQFRLLRSNHARAMRFPTLSPAR